MKNSIICISVVVTILLMASCTNNSETLLSEAKLILDSNSSEKSEIIKVVENMKIVLKEDPNSIIAINYLLNAYTQLDDQNSKMSYLNEEIEKRNKLLEIFIYNRGMVKTLQNDKEGAIEDFENAIRLSPNNRKAYNNIVTLKLEKEYFVNNQWVPFTKDDIQKIINEVYPENEYKPTIEEYINSDQICYIDFSNINYNK